MGDLSQGVHPGIRPPTASHPRLVVGHPGQCPFHGGLHGGFLALNLPTQELASVVFKAYGIAQSSELIHHRRGFGLLFFASVLSNLFKNHPGGFLVPH